MTKVEELAFEAGWWKGWRRGQKSHSSAVELDDARRAAFEAYKREIAEPDRCGSCGTLITQGTTCSSCRISD